MNMSDDEFWIIVERAKKQELEDRMKRALKLLKHFESKIKGECKMKIIGLNENNQATPFIELGDILVLDGGEYVMQVVQTSYKPEVYNALTLRFPDDATELYSMDSHIGFKSQFDVYDNYIKEGFKVDIVKASRLELHIK